MLFPLRHRRRAGCCTRLRIQADSARFVLLAGLLFVYLMCGAALFQWLEQAQELDDRRRFQTYIQQFKQKHHLQNSSELDILLRAQTKAYLAGVLEEQRERWDFVGSFYFVGTIVTTIGFGMTTPKTSAGKIALIVYGFVGCSGGILFFNLFLERIITFWAFILRQVHHCVCKRRRRPSRKSGSPNGVQKSELGSIRRESYNSTEEESSQTEASKQWKPSVYKVQFLLFTTAALLSLAASSMYMHMEAWDLLDSVYFCFVAFSTIGFGDLVSNQKRQAAATGEFQRPPTNYLYTAINFLCILLGCCFVYSFFNVTSLVIRTLLDWLIKRMDITCGSADCLSRCEEKFCCPWRTPVSRSSLMVQVRRQQQRRNAFSASSRGQSRGQRAFSVSSSSFGTRRVSCHTFLKRSRHRGARGTTSSRATTTTTEQVALTELEDACCGGSATAGGYMSDNEMASSASQCSDEMISIQDFLHTNKVALAMIQKQLWETAQRSHSSHGVGLNVTSGGASLSDGVGPLAIVDHKLGPEDV